MILSKKDYCEIYKISPTTEYRQRLSGAGPSYLKIGRKVMYRRSDVEDWLSNNTFQSRKDEDQKNRIGAWVPPSDLESANIRSHGDEQKVSATRCLMAANGVVACTIDESDPVVGFLLRGGA